MRKRRWLLGLLATLVVLGVWQRWYVRYLLQAGTGQARLLWRARPIAAARQDPALPQTAKRKLALVERAKAFAEIHLGLKPSGSYTAYSDIGPGPVSYALTASPADRLEHHQWWFPIVGNVPYLGFFRPEEAGAAATEMAAQGYDTDVREVPAYSTLGWFRDPVTSPMLAYDDRDLASTIIHELTHGTLYVPGAGDFNESLATFVGLRGAIEFWCGEMGRECAAASEGWRDTLAFAGYIGQLHGRLAAILLGPGSREERLRRKEALLASVPDDFAAWRQREGVRSYAAFGRRKLNNAVILSLYLYYRHLPLFEAAFRHQGQDVRGFLELVRSRVAGRDDPLAAIRELAAPG